MHSVSIYCHTLEELLRPHSCLIKPFYSLHLNTAVAHYLVSLLSSSLNAVTSTCHKIITIPLGQDWDADVEEFVRYDLSSDSSLTLSFSDEALKAAVKERGSLAAVLRLKTRKRASTVTPLDDASWCDVLVLTLVLFHFYVDVVQKTVAFCRIQFWFIVMSRD